MFHIWFNCTPKYFPIWVVQWRLSATEISSVLFLVYMTSSVVNTDNSMFTCNSVSRCPVVKAHRFFHCDFYDIKKIEE